MRAMSLACAAAAVFLTMLGGCATNRTDGNRTLDASYISPRPEKVLISEGSLPGREYWRVGPVEAIATKPLLSREYPTKEQADAMLVEKARKIGADAIINVTYSKGFGLTTGGQIEARGIAVKLVE